MDPQHLYECDQLDLDEELIEPLKADISRYFEFLEIAGRVAPRPVLSHHPFHLDGHVYRWESYYDGGSGLWACQLRRIR